MIFSRRARAGRHAKAETATKTRDRGSDKAARRAALLADLELTDDFADPAKPERAPRRPAKELWSGPYDSSEAPPAERVDLGSLLIPGIDGVEFRAQAGEGGTIQNLELAYGDSVLQLGVFAAPRTDSLWDEVRPEIRKALFTDGVGAEEVPGKWGTELRARLRTQQGFDDLRFVGIDGPRWMIRAVFRGPAAADPSQAGPLNDCLAGLVVHRDEEARPTREALPLRIPAESAPVDEPDAAEIPPAVAEVPRRKPSPRPRRD